MFDLRLRVAGSSLTGVTALCPSARHINPCLVLVQPRKSGPDITEKLLTGMSNQTINSLRLEFANPKPGLQVKKVFMNAQLNCQKMKFILLIAG